jgi:signal transduction histidine kinase
MIVVINRDYEIVFLDGEELQKTGLDKEVVEGLHVQEVKSFSPEWRNRMIAHAQKTFNGENFSYEIKYKSNTYKVNTMPLDDGQFGNNLVLFVFTNVTEQKKTEVKMLKALKKERELSELKSRFVSMASHEFRTPLSTILSTANLIARQNEPGKEDKRLKNVERNKSSVKNLVDILNEFLSIGRLEEGEVSMKQEVFDLTDFMKTIMQELQHVQKPGQQVRLTSHPKIIHVYLDKQFTRNVFLNLLSNALKYSPHNKPVDIHITAETSNITVKVQDQGIGIPEDEHQNLFNLFFRARNVTNIEGTGLGLPIAKKYIELMNGKITFESRLEQGTTFTITLPHDQHNNEKDSIDRR